MDSLRQELAWEELSIRRKIHKLSYFYKIVYNNYFPLYLIELLPKLVNERSYIPLRSGHNISQLSVELKNLRNHSFLPQFRCGILLILTLETQLLFQALS